MAGTTSICNIKIVKHLVYSSTYNCLAKCVKLQQQSKNEHQKCFLHVMEEYWFPLYTIYRIPLLGYIKNNKTINLSTNIEAPRVDKRKCRMFIRFTHNLTLQLLYYYILLLSYSYIYYTPGNVLEFCFFQQFPLLHSLF